jgi:hypothetical protein
VDAGSEAAVLAGLAQVAAAARVGEAAGDARAAAVAVRHWLEGDGTRRLLVFDNIADLDGLRPFLPAGGAAQVVITSSRRPASGLGTPVPVDVFTEAEALAYLAGRTGLDDAAGARELAGELGSLPLGLAQAAALIAREHLGYGRYLRRRHAATELSERLVGANCPASRAESAPRAAARHEHGRARRSRLDLNGLNSAAYRGLGNGPACSEPDQADIT